mgnify:FL=1
MTEGFFSRWSRRKAGKEKEGEVDQQLDLKKAVAPTADISPAPQENTSTQTPPPVTLEDVEKIDRFAPDFSAFMKPDVDPAVQQAALKKMFSDPHFNVMDGLDIYIDDYSKPDPLPQGMLERMVQSDMLNLFRKKSDVVAEQSVDAKLTGSAPDPENEALAVDLKTDLTSTGIQGADESTNELTKEVKNVSGPSSALEQKKT